MLKLSCIEIRMFTNVFVLSQIMCAANNCCALSLMWGLQSLDQNNPDKDALKHLKKNLHNFMKCSQSLLTQERRVQEEVRNRQ